MPDRRPMIEEVNVYGDLVEPVLWLSTLVRTVSFRYIDTAPSKFLLASSSTAELGAAVRLALDKSVDEFPNPGGSKNASFQFESPILEPMGCKNWRAFHKRYILAFVSREGELCSFQPTYRRGGGNVFGPRFGDIRNPSDEELGEKILEALDKSR